MKPKISTKNTLANRTTILKLLKEVPAKVDMLSHGFSEEDIKRPFSPNEWSFAEQLSHMLHCEATTANAIYQALIVNESAVVDIHPERQLGKLIRYNLLSFEEMKQLFVIRRKVLLRVLTNLRSEQWGNKIDKGGKRMQSVYLLVRMMVLHEVDHLINIEQNIEGRQ